jgi:hypothetical protein
MKKMSFFIFLFSLALFSSCQPKGQVEVSTSGIFKPITFGITPPIGDGRLVDLSGASIDLDEWDITKGPLPVVITITNHSRFPYTNINIKSKALDNDDDETNTNIRYALHSGEDVGFPGYGGTCQRILAPGNSCTVKMELVFPIEGIYQEQLKLTFKNLVDPEEHTGSIKVLSGVPANLEVIAGSQLVKFNEVNNPKIFKPLVERTGGKTYRQTVTFKNVGGLKARDLSIVKPLEVCSNLSGGECGADYQSVYQYQATCEGVKTLLPGESCTVEISYRPKNIEDVDLGDDEEITYRGGVQFIYFKNPDKALSSLALNFESISSKIEGRLRADGSINLKTTTQGNRDSQEVLVSNIGYRELRIKKLIFKYFLNGSTTNNDWAECTASADPASQALVCQSSDGNFPFRVTDTNNCLKRTYRTIEINGASHTVEREADLTIGGNCKFILTFAPATSEYFVNDPNSFFASNYAGGKVNVFFEYDSQWKGGEDQCLGLLSCTPDPTKYIKSKDKTTVTASRLSAARLEVTTVTFNESPTTAVAKLSDNYSTPVDHDADPATPTIRPFSVESRYDLKDQILMASKYRLSDRHFKKIQITIKNNGGTTAKLLKIYTPRWSADGDIEEVIPFDRVSVKAHLADNYNCNSTDMNCFFRQAKTLQDCREIAAGATCTIEVSFAPFVRSNITTIPCSYKDPASPDVLYYDCSMFDPGSFENLTKNPFKSFVVRYTNGIKFQNKNNDDTTSPPFEWVESKVQIEAKLFAAGRLMEISDNALNPKLIERTVRGSLINYSLYMENIGAGVATALKLNLPSTSPFTTVFQNPTDPTPEECGSMVGDKDCRCYRYADKTKGLPSEDVCVYNFVSQSQPEIPSLLPSSDQPLLLLNLINNSFSHNYHRTITNDVNIPFATEYYDCFGDTIGTKRTTRNHNVSFRSQLTPAIILPKLTMNSANAWHSSYLERFQLSYNSSTKSYSYSDASKFFIQTRDDQSFDLTLQTSPGTTHFNDTLRSFLESRRAILPKDRLSMTLPSDDPEGEYRDTNYYHFFLGSFPAYTTGGTNIISGELTLRNEGQKNSELVFDLGDDGTNSIQVAALGTPITDISNGTIVPISSLSAVTLRFSMTPTSTCVPDGTGQCLFQRVVTFTYSTGKTDLDKDGNPSCNNTEDKVGTNFYRAPLKDQCQRKVTILVSGLIQASESVAPFDVKQLKIGVEEGLKNFVDFTCDTSKYSSLFPGYNQRLTTSSGAPATILSMVGTKGSKYSKTLVTFTNNTGGDLVISHLNIRTPEGINSTEVNSLYGIKLNDSVPSGSSQECMQEHDKTKLCSRFISSNTPLPNNKDCIVSIRYLPPTNTNDIPPSLLLSMSYYDPNKSPFHRNIVNVPLNFEIRSRSILHPKGLSASITPKIKTPTIFEAPSYVQNLNLPSPGYLTFNGGNTFYESAPINLTTTGTDRASLLKQWLSLPGNTSAPTISDFGPDGFTIMSIASGLEGDFLEVRANQNCFTRFTGDAGCQLKFKIKISEQNLYRNSKMGQNSTTISDHEKKNNAYYITPIKYFDLNDDDESKGDIGTSFGTMYIYLVFDVRPSPSGFNPGFRAESSIQSSTEFFVNNPPPHNPNDNLGEIVGYRLIRFRSKNDIKFDKSGNDITEYLNLKNTSTITIRDFYNADFYSTNLFRLAPPVTNNEFFYYRILAIRNSSSFNFGTSAFGLVNSRYYLSEINTSTQRILTPSLTVKYLIPENVIVDNSYSLDYLNYSTSLSWCSGQSVSIIDNLSSKTYSKSLMTEPVFLALTDHPRLPFWIKTAGSFNFELNCRGMTSDMVDYLNCMRITPSAESGQLVRGGLSNILNTASNYQFAYVDPLFDEGIHARCYTQLPSP